VGDPMRLQFDVLLGRPVADAHRAERAARPTEVVVAPAVRDAMGDAIRCRPRSPEGDVVTALEVLVREDPFRTSATLPSETVVPWVPAEIRDRLVTDGVHLLSENRQHATVFVGLGGPSWVSAPGPSAIDELDRRVRWLQDAFEAQGGMVLNVVQDGRGVYAWAGMGAPVARADDVQRALRCVLGLRRLPGSLGGDALPVGVALDDVWSGAVGCRPRVQYAVLGEGVWQAGGCTSWYMDAEGRNTTLWPGTVAEFQKRMAQSGLEQYRPAALGNGES